MLYHNGTFLAVFKGFFYPRQILMIVVIAGIVLLQGGWRILGIVERCALRINCVFLGDPVDKKLITDSPDFLFAKSAFYGINLYKTDLPDSIYPQVEDIFFNPFADSVKNPRFVFYFDFPEH